MQCHYDSSLFTVLTFGGSRFHAVSAATANAWSEVQGSYYFAEFIFPDISRQNE